MFECGLIDIGATLVARWAALPNGLFLTNAVSSADRRCFYQLTADMRLVEIQFSPSPSTPNFPYQWGAFIEPDAPV